MQMIHGFRKMSYVLYTTSELKALGTNELGFPSFSDGSTAVEIGCKALGVCNDHLCTSLYPSSAASFPSDLISTRVGGDSLASSEIFNLVGDF